MGSYSVAVAGKLVQIYKININIYGEKQYTKRNKNTEHTYYTAKHRNKKTNIKRIKFKKLIRTKQRTKDVVKGYVFHFRNVYR